MSRMLVHTLDDGEDDLIVLTAIKGDQTRGVYAPSEKFIQDYRKMKFHDFADAVLKPMLEKLFAQA